MKFPKSRPGSEMRRKKKSGWTTEISMEDGKLALRLSVHLFTPSFIHPIVTP